MNKYKKGWKELKSNNKKKITKARENIKKCIINIINI